MQMKRCGVLGWDGYSGTGPRRMTDGTMFRLHAEVNGGRAVYASGSNRFPRHYHDFRDWILRRLDGDGSF